MRKKVKGKFYAISGGAANHLGLYLTDGVAEFIESCEVADFNVLLDIVGNVTVPAEALHITCLSDKGHSEEYWAYFVRDHAGVMRRITPMSATSID